MKKTVWIGVAFLVVVVGFVVMSTLSPSRERCEVCITFQGKTDCRIASATTREQAQRAATENACSQLAAGVTESIQCGNTPPDSVRWR